jgi:hypothetical protein
MFLYIIQPYQAPRLLCLPINDTSLYGIRENKSERRYIPSLLYISNVSMKYLTTVTGESTCNVRSKQRQYV